MDGNALSRISSDFQRCVLLTRDWTKKGITYKPDTLQVPGLPYNSHFMNAWNITEKGAMAIASAACKKHLGFRGLKSLIFKVLSDDM